MPGGPPPPTPTYLVGITQTVAAATELCGRGIDGGEGHGLLGQEGGRGLDQGWRVSEGRAQAPLLAQDLLVGHGVDGVGKGEGRAAEKGRQGDGEGWGEVGAGLCEAHASWTDRTLPGDLDGHAADCPVTMALPTQAPVAPQCRPSQASTSVRSPQALPQDAAFVPGPSLLCRLRCAPASLMLPDYLNPVLMPPRPGSVSRALRFPLSSVF